MSLPYVPSKIIFICLKCGARERTPITPDDTPCDCPKYKVPDFHPYDISRDIFLEKAKEE